MAGTYVMMFGIANIVAGGPIYCCNKIRYMEEKGWTVNVLPTDTGEIFIKPLEKYKDICFPFLLTLPFRYTRKQLNLFLDLLVQNVTVSDNIIIETGTDYTALWGELLARKLSAKHVIIFLDEKNPRINEHNAPFYQFKYERGELAGISTEALKANFAQYFELKDVEQHYIGCYAVNSVADVEFEDTLDLKDYEYVIGSIGRLDKPYVSSIIEGICQFADYIAPSGLFVILIGGADDAYVDAIVQQLITHENIRYYLTGYIWPIPSQLIKKANVYVSGAGSSLCSANLRVPTIDLDVYTGLPIGFLKSARPWTDESEDSRYEVIDAPGQTVFDYIKEVLINGHSPTIENVTTLEDEWHDICCYMDLHWQFIQRSSAGKEYYETEKIWDGRIISRISRIMMHMTGYNVYSRLQKIYHNLFYSSLK